MFSMTLAKECVPGRYSYGTLVPDWDFTKLTSVALMDPLTTTSLAKIRGAQRRARLQLRLGYVRRVHCFVSANVASENVQTYCCVR